MTYTAVISSPVGPLYLASDGAAMTGLWMEGQKYFGSTLEHNTAECPDLSIFRQTRAWLDAYFSRTPLPSLPPLSPGGTPFRQAVWKLLMEIPYGETTTYGELAHRLRTSGVSATAQAVGGAVGHNPLSILIPCHRVVGADGNLTGYAGGIPAKRFLLRLEGVNMENLYDPKYGTAKDTVR